MECLSASDFFPGLLLNNNDDGSGLEWTVFYYDKELKDV